MLSHSDDTVERTSAMKYGDGIESDGNMEPMTRTTNNDDLEIATATSSSWQSQITGIISRRNLSIQEQTPASAAALLDQFGYFGDGVTMPHQVEQNLFEAFMEDDYDGALHLTIIRQEKSDNGTISLPIGLIFWREMPEKEVREWINHERLGQLARQWHSQVRTNHYSAAHGADTNDSPAPPRLSINNLGSQMFGSSSPERSQEADKLPKQPGRMQELPSWEYDKHEPHRVRHSLTRTRQESLKWLGKLARTSDDDDDDDSSKIILENSPTSETSSLVSSLVPSDYAQSWVKIELLAVRQPWWGQKIGSLLLACAMYEAWHRNNKRTVLHIAGGSSNVPALKLYHKFGFLPAKGLFHKPNKDVYVLGNIELALQSILWQDVLTIRQPPALQDVTTTVAEIVAPLNH